MRDAIGFLVSFHVLFSCLVNSTVEWWTSFNADSSIDVISHIHCALWVSKTPQTSKSVRDKTFYMLSNTTKYVQQ